jgi:predicted tellurium resistance membrane protein TerC
MEIVIALLALTAMEIVLGIDNIVFITIVSSKLPESQQPLARRIGLALALIMRLGLLFTLSYVMTNLTYDLFTMTSLGIPQDWVARLGMPESYAMDGKIVVDTASKHFAEANGISVRDLILLIGGGFLIAKSVFEIHEQMNPHEANGGKGRRAAFVGVLFQIVILDIVFSLDSVITAVGMVNDLWIMSAAIIVAVIVMLVFSERISRFVQRHPTLKMLALSFLILIGVMLVAESIGARMDKGYIYFAMFFALLVEFLNIRLRSKTNRVHVK